MQWGPIDERTGSATPGRVPARGWPADFTAARASSSGALSAAATSCFSAQTAPGSSPESGHSHARQFEGLCSTTSSAASRSRFAPWSPGWPPRCFPIGRALGRSTSGVSCEGGCEELQQLRGRFVRTETAQSTDCRARSRRSCTSLRYHSAHDLDPSSTGCPEDDSRRIAAAPCGVRIVARERELLSAGNATPSSSWACQPAASFKHRTTGS
jgi:hypothetical protein